MLDAIVVGARCSGSSLGLELAKRGHRVLVVDRARFPSDTISSHLLLPRGSSYLARMGLLDRVLETTPSFEYMGADFEGVVMNGRVDEAALDKRHRQLHGEPLAQPVSKWISARRRVLDTILVDAAARAGADVREEFLVEDLVYADDRVVGIRGRTRAGTPVEERARVIVGADGRHSFVARKLGLQRRHEQPSMTFCYWGYYSDVSLDAIGGPRLIKRGRLRIAAVPTHQGATAVSVWGPGEWFRDFRRDLDANFVRVAEYCAPTLAEMIRPPDRRTERLHGSADLGNFIRDPAGAGWALLGDAAASHDQCIAVGMTHALRDAALLSEELDAGFSGRSSIDDALARYRDRRFGDHTLEYHQYICGESEMKCHSREELALFAAMRGNPEALNASLAMIADVIPPSEFFAPANLEAIHAAANELVDLPAIVRHWEASQARYRENPFLTT